LYVVVVVVSGMQLTIAWCHRYEHAKYMA